MRFSPAVAAVLAAVVALALSGCTAPTAESGLDKGTSVSVAWNEPFDSNNPATSFGNSTANTNVASLTTDWFTSYDDTPRLVEDESFGSQEVVSTDPLTVKYTVKAGVKWSDGTRVDAADLLLDWAANSRALDTPQVDPADFTDPETGELTDDVPKDTVYFDSGAQPDSGLGLVHDVPTISDDGRSITMVYSAPFVDWDLAFPSALPAHVVGKKALGLNGNREAKAALIRAIRDNDTEALAKISSFWNSGFNFTELPDDPELYLSTGPYTISDVRAGKYVTLKANPEYTGARKPSIDEVTIRFIADPLAAAQALRDGLVDVVSTPGTAAQVAALDTADTTLLTGQGGTYEHIDLQFDQSRNDVFADPRVREAFLKVIPRKKILHELIAPIMGTDASLRDSQVFVPGAAGSADSAADNGSAGRHGVDLRGARALLARAGVTHPEVCILYETSNPRRVKEFRLIQSSAGKAGFTVTDCGATEWRGLLGTPGAYDAALFGWPAPSLAVSNAGPTFATGGSNNFNFFSDPAVDALIERLDAEFDRTRQVSLQQELDRLLSDSFYGATLFNLPVVTAFNDRIEGVSPSILAPTVFWNVWDWTVTADG